MAYQGWDSLTVDMQHGLTGLETAIQMIQVISTRTVVPLVGTSWNDPGMIMRVLDAGAYGVICPMINTRAEAETFVKACRHHPDGDRSLGPTRAKVSIGDDYALHANREVAAIAMIETTEALDILNAISGVPGLDMLYVGPGDLRLSLLGEGGVDNHDPLFMEAVEHVIATATRHRFSAVSIPIRQFMHV